LIDIKSKKLNLLKVCNNIIVVYDSSGFNL
jgi:hypothetical protein